MQTRDNRDIWICLDTTDGIKYQLRLGSTGVISNIKNSEGDELLSPSYKEEKTDRVVQWTLWSNTLKRQINELPEYEWRYNVTQAGDFDGNFNRTASLSVTDGIIEVISTPDLNWKIEQQRYFRGGFKAMTLYNVDKRAPYILRIKRYILVDKVYLNDRLMSLGNTYLEGWTPIRRPTYNAVAMSFNSSNQPEWWYDMNNIPSYPNLRVEDTNGYIVGFNNDNREAGEVFALIYGKKNIDRDDGRVVVNMMNWDTGIGLLPALSIDNLEEGDLIEMNLSIICNKGINYKFIRTVMTEVQNHPNQNLYKRGKLRSAPQNVIDIYHKLYTVPGNIGIRADSIGKLLT